MNNVIIIGSGPAGLMAGNILKEHNTPFLILEKNPLPGKKLLITGGGRCNITNALSKRDFMESLTINKRFLYSSLHSFSTDEIIDFFKNKNVPLVLDKGFKYFPKSNRSKDIVDALVYDIKDSIIYNQEVVQITKDEYFTVKTNNKSYQAKNVIIATGSMSYPNTGSTGFGLKIASKFEIDSIPFYPAETSIYSDFIKINKSHLQGIAIQDTLIKIPGTKIQAQGDVLFTHFGLSGPAVQHISEDVYKLNPPHIVFSVTKYNEGELIDLFEEYKNTDKTLLRFVEETTINRFAKFILDQLKLTHKKVKETSNKERNVIITTLTQYPVEVTRTEYKENAYVNGGGVNVLELNPKSFESKKVKNLYFIGETVDVHGPIGGFNITIALSMGHSAAMSIVNK